MSTNILDDIANSKRISNWINMPFDVWHISYAIFIFCVCIIICCIIIVFKNSNLINQGINLINIILLTMLSIFFVSLTGKYISLLSIMYIPTIVPTYLRDNIKITKSKENPTNKKQKLHININNIKIYMFVFLPAFIWWFILWIVFKKYTLNY